MQIARTHIFIVSSPPRVTIVTQSDATRTQDVSEPAMQQYEGE
jgi:hypothetical protein